MTGLFAGSPLEQPVTCEHCGQAIDGRDRCVCPRDTHGEARPPKLQHPRVRREKRRGKWNTVIADIHASPGPGTKDLKPLLKALRTQLGTGGGLSDAESGPEIVLQGDHKEAVVELLKTLGYRVKAAGG